MAILADRVSAVVAVDTHVDTDTAAVLTPAGGVVDEITVDADPAGYAKLVTWADEHAPPGRRAWVIDGSRSHGVGLLRYLRTHVDGDELIEAERVSSAKARRRGQGKSDSLDAVRIGRAALAADRVATPRADGDREALRMLVALRRHLSDTRTATINHYKALIVTADDQLREQLRHRSTATQLRLLTQGPVAAPVEPDLAARIRREHLAGLAADIVQLGKRLTENKKQINALVKTMCAALLDVRGVGPVTAAIALLAWSHKGRVRSEAAFAALAGVNPIPASSGRTTRHRLNRGGDRSLNSALYTIAKTRRRHDDTTKAYVARRTAQGRTSTEITRCLKRYLARKLYRIMQTTAVAA